MKSKKDSVLGMDTVRLCYLASRLFPFSVFWYICSHKEYLKLARAQKTILFIWKTRKKDLKKKRIKNKKIFL